MFVAAWNTPIPKPRYCEQTEAAAKKFVKHSGRNRQVVSLILLLKPKLHFFGDDVAERAIKPVHFPKLPYAS